MKLLYPASHEIPKLSETQLIIKIARHSPCSICDDCNGLHPAPGMNVVSDEKDMDSSLESLEQNGSKDETSYLDTCDCGHTARDHGADVSNTGSEEFARKGRVAVRLDELLQVCILSIRMHITPELKDLTISGTEDSLLCVGHR
jgi:histone acetyltransferase